MASTAIALAGLCMELATPLTKGDGGRSIWGAFAGRSDCVSSCGLFAARDLLRVFRRGLSSSGTTSIVEQVLAGEAEGPCSRRPCASTLPWLVVGPN